MKLDPHAIKNHTEEGVHGDGNGLYLQVAANGTKSWIYRYQLDGRRRSMGLGGYPSISLATARFEDSMCAAKSTSETHRLLETIAHAIPDCIFHCLVDVLRVFFKSTLRSPTQESNDDKF